jgi:nitrogen fixation NifU-like protein
MSGDLHRLYERMILDHQKRPRNFRAIERGQAAEGHNPLCGDRLTVYLRVEGDRIVDASFLGTGCAIATASASMMTELVTGRTVGEADALFADVRRLLTSAPEAPVDDLGAITALAGVRRFPSRVKCATLAWEALLAATSHAPCSPAQSSES